MNCRPTTCRPTTEAQHAESLHDVVRAYIAMYRHAAAQELRRFAIQRTLSAAIEKASRCQSRDGKQHGHQRRIPSRSLAEANRRLQLRCSDIQRCPSFALLHALVKEEIDPIPMVGALTVYDIAHRIGAKLGLEPEVVYLHVGTAQGARALLPASRVGKLPLCDLPQPFHSLKPYEAEDCLCIYKKEISRIVGGGG